MSFNHININICLTTYNGKSRLSQTLFYLSNLNINNFKSVELIVVDNASNDGTSDFVKTKWEEFGNKFPLILVRLEENDLPKARKTAMDLADGDFVITCDDDNLFPVNYLELGVQYFLKNPRIGVLGAQGMVKSNISIPEWFHKYSYYFGCSPQAPNTGNVYPTRNVVYGAGMWHRNVVYKLISKIGFKYILKSREIGKLGCGDDSELCWAIKFAGYEIWYAEDLVFEHFVSDYKMTKDYLNNLLNYHNINGPYGNLHYRVYTNQLTAIKKYFWLREFVFYLIYLFKIPFFKFKNQKPELKRVLKSMKILLIDRGKYDESIKFLVDFKNKLDKISK